MKKKLEDYQLHRRLSYRWSLVTKLMHNSLDCALSPQKISLTQWYILAGIEIENHCSPSELADHIGVSRPAVSRLLKGMESDQLIERNIMAVDGRTRMLTLTEKGREALNASWDNIEQNESCFMSKLTVEQLEALNGIIDTVMHGVGMEEKNTPECTS